MEAQLKAQLKAHLCCEMLSASVVQMSRAMDVSGQRESPGKCHNSRPMVDSAPDLRRGHLSPLARCRFAESPTLEEPWKKLPMNHHRLSFVQTSWILSILYYHHIHHISTGMPEANGYYCQCIHLTTRTKHTPPDKRGICRKDARHKYMPPRCLLTRPGTQLCSSPRSQPICAARKPHTLG